MARYALRKDANEDRIVAAQTDIGFPPIDTAKPPQENDRMRQTYTAAEVAKLKKIWTKQLAMALQENEKLRMELRGLVQETSTRANQLSNHCGNVDRMMLCLPIYNHKTLPHAPRTQG